MDTILVDWINRVGIILNFIAGFLLAPEIIGIERLQRLENTLETKIADLETKIRPIVYQYEENSKYYGSRDKESQFLMFLLTCLSFVPALFIVSLILLPIDISIIAYSLVSKNQNFSTLEISVYYFGAIALFLIIFILGLFFLMLSGNSNEKKLHRRLFQGMKQAQIMGLGTLAILSLLKMHPLLSALIKKINEQSTLQSYMVWLGIFFFVLGNLFQLLATF